MKRELVLDTETTGLDYENGHRLVEIGIVELDNHIPTGNYFHYYITIWSGLFIIFLPAKYECNIGPRINTNIFTKCN